MFRTIAVVFSCVVVSCCGPLFGQNEEGQANPVAELPAVRLAPRTDGDAASLKQKASYIIGYNMAKGMVTELNNQRVDIDFEQLLAGMKTAVEGGELKMTEEEINSVSAAFQKQIEVQHVERMTKLATANRAEGDAFLKSQSSIESIKKLENGVLYEVLTEGTGDSPKLSDRISIHYHGTLPNGTVFDSTTQPPNGGKSEPAEFGVSQVVHGFSAALQAMKTGSKWRVVIPSDLAYGAAGKGSIEPNQTLIFEIELLEILK